MIVLKEKGLNKLLVTQPYHAEKLITHGLISSYRHNLYNVNFDDYERRKSFIEFMTLI